MVGTWRKGNLLVILLWVDASDAFLPRSPPSAKVFHGERRSQVRRWYHEARAGTPQSKEEEDTGTATVAEELVNADGMEVQPVNLAELSLIPDVSPLLDAVDAMPPTKLEPRPPPIPIQSNNIDSALCKTFNYDIGHAGRFTVFGSGGATLAPDFVFDQESPLSYIQQNLCLGQARPDELVVFSPGLNTIHEPSGRQRTSPMRVAHYNRVLGIGMAQVQTGTQMDQGDIVVDPVTEKLEAFLRERGRLFDEETIQQLEEARWSVGARDRDKIQVVLSSRNLIETPIKDTLRRLLDVAASNVLSKKTEEPHLVLMSYSRATVETMAALQTWKKEAKAKFSLSTEQVEDLLREAVTIVTVGAASRGFPDGPAYMHVSMLEDKLTKSLGPTEQRKGGGRDARYIHSNSPYASTNEGNDSHNMGACVGQLLAAVMLLSGTTSFREIYNQWHTIPEDSDLATITSAMIRATKGYEWLWFPDLAFEGMPAIPSEEVSKRVLDDEFGVGTYDKFADASKGGLNEIIDTFQVDRAVADEQFKPGKSENTMQPQPSNPEEKEDLAAKYAAIESLEERAYQILLDLGMA